MSQRPKLLNPTDYIEDVTQKIYRATDRICIISMIVADDESTDELIDALIAAAKRGVKVEIAADIFTYGELGGFFWPTKLRSIKARETSRMSKELKDNGVKFNWLGRNNLIIFSGRTHTKWCVIDNYTYSFGGVNLYEKGINNNDFILSFDDKDLADAICNEYKAIISADKKAQPIKSHSFACEYGNVLVDGGAFFDSIIYRRAVKLAKESFRIRLVSQYCPTGKLGRLLKKTNSELYFNPSENATALNRLVIKLGMFFSKNYTQYKKQQYLHAKFMIFETFDGKKIAITGSNNFVYAGVVFGTKEIALETDNVEIISQLENFIEDNIK